MSDYSSPMSTYGPVKQEEIYSSFPLHNTEKETSPILHNSQHSQLDFPKHKVDYFKRHSSLLVSAPHSLLSEENITSGSQTAPIQFTHPFQYISESDFYLQTPEGYFNTPASNFSSSNLDFQQWNFDPNVENSNLLSYSSTSGHQKSTKGTKVVV